MNTNKTSNELGVDLANTQSKKRWAITFRQIHQASLAADKNKTNKKEVKKENIWGKALRMARMNHGLYKLAMQYPTHTVTDGG